MKCCRCSSRISRSESYGKDDGKTICWDCLMDYIIEEYRLEDIADGVGIEVEECEEEDFDEEEPAPVVCDQLKGQLDIFGNEVI